VEPFAGAASVLLRKPPARYECLNDLDGEVVGFFRVLRERPGDLVRAVERTPFARAEVDLACAPAPPGLDEVERARRVYVRAWQGRHGLPASGRLGWRFERAATRNRTAVDDWRDAAHLWAVAERLRRVQLECDDALAVVRRFDGPDTLFYCLAPGQLVRTADERLVPVEAVRPGEVLFGGRVVRRALTRQYAGPLREFRVQGLPDPLVVTADHPMLIVPGRRGGRQERRGDAALWRQQTVRPASQVQAGDYVLVPTGGAAAPVQWRWDDEPRAPNARRRPARFQPGPELYRFLGYFAAEGHLQRGAGGHPAAAVLSFCTDELGTWVADAVRCVEAAFGFTPTVRPGSPHPAATQVWVGSTTVAGLAAHYVAGLQPVRALHPDLLTAPAGLQREVLIGWLRGDGGADAGSRHRLRLLGTSRSEALARQMFLLALRCGLRPSFKSRPSGEARTYDVYFASEDAASLGWDVPAGRFRSARRLTNGHVLARIRGITERHYDGPVHDLDVDGDDLFAAPFALTHNCDPPYPASTRCARWRTCAYAHELTDDDHRRLAGVLRAVRGLVVLSGAPCALYRDLYPGWTVVRRRAQTQANRPATEALWLSPRAAERLRARQLPLPEPAESADAPEATE
jgi:site-specific DNA-adenine methylase